MKKHQPKLTEPQRYAVGSAVESAYLQQGWDSKLAHKAAPCIHDATFHSGASVPQIKALLRQKIILPSPKGIHKLTALGIEVGEAETLERTGVLVRAQAEKNRKDQKEIDAKHTEEVTALIRPFKGITIMRKERFSDKRRSLALTKLLIRTFANRSPKERIEFNQDEMREIGEQIST